MSYELGYETSKTVDVHITTKAEISTAIEALGLGASFEVSVQSIAKTSQSTKKIEKTSYKIAGGFNFWICQRQAHLKVYNQPNAVSIFDAELVISGEMC